ncbi:MAG: membrane protein insertion efficiency factor YidD [Micavibrio aeruginosavorus]|uniref:Putative membrane protein insertion efficiency factor n=1 Tax=Micavibrio aeruginosavorus TaxID=349221 RepID=A0A2W5N7Y4_9BACT|nr:MAG: membrane protein insertion efficiency factor YidD [Micavibrio aeruginosavorus]
MRLIDLPKKAMKGLISAYAYAVSPLLGQNCRFYPTCSIYAVDAIEKHGAIKGGILGAKRICKCHPFYKGTMLDPVPESVDWRGIIGYKRAKSAPSENCGATTHKLKD